MSLKYLTKDDSFASLSALALKRELGEEISKWDPEVLWISLASDGIKLSDITKAKINSFLAIDVNPMVIWEINTFQNTVLAANNVYPLTEIVQECTPFELAWGLIEIRDYLITQEIVGSTQKIKWGDDITKYIAACLWNSGWLIAPKPLSMAQESLDVINKNLHLKEQILFNLNKNTLPTVEDEVSIQVSRIKEYNHELEIKFKEFSLHREKLDL